MEKRAISSAAASPSPRHCAMCGLKSERARHGVPRTPASSRGAGHGLNPGLPRPKTWGSDLAPPSAPGTGAPRPSPPAVQHSCCPQVLSGRPSLRGRAARSHVPGRIAPGCPPSGVPAAGAGRAPRGARASSQRRLFAVGGFRINRVCALSLPQDRHDGSSNGTPRIPHLSSAGQHLYSPAPPLSHAGVGEYQPPYFPPPYQQLAYSQSADPYSHLGEAYAAAINPLHQPAPTSSQQQSWPGRQGQEGAGLPAHHGRPAGLLPHLSGLDGGSVSSRRDAYRRSDLLLPHAHSLDATGLADNLGLHDMAHQMDEVQVSRGSEAPAGTRVPRRPPNLKETLSFLPQNVDDQHLLLHDQTVIRKGK